METSGLKILVVDDVPVNQIILRRMIESEGAHQVESAGDGQGAVDRAQHDRFDLIFMDLQMPVLNGVEATRLIRSTEGSRRSYICALTAGSAELLWTLCREAGMDTFLMKPIQQKDLLAVVQKVAYLHRPFSLPGSSGEGAASIIFNRQELLNRLEGASEMLESFVEMFISSAMDHLCVLEAAVEQRDLEKIRFHAHTLAGTAGNIGAGALKQISLQLELTAKVGASDQIPQLFQRLLNAFDSFNAAVQPRSLPEIH